MESKDADMANGGAGELPSHFLNLNHFRDDYSTHGSVYRLAFAAVSYPRDAKLREEAIKAVKAEGYNTDLYETLCTTEPQLGPVDTEWVLNAKKEYSSKLAALEKDLGDQMGMELRAGIKNALYQLGSLAVRGGHLEDGFKRLEHCSEGFAAGGAEKMDVCGSAAAVALQLKDASEANRLAQRVLREYSQTGSASSTDAAALQAVFTAHVILGLLAFMNGSYREAALEFCAATPALHEADLFASSDVALYVSLAAAAGLSRDEIRQKVLGNRKLAEMLEALPGTRQLLQQIITTKYGEALATLNNLQRRVLVDPFIAERSSDVAREIRSSSLVLACKPYSAISISALATTFDTSSDAMQDELEKLINAGDLTARIDCDNGLLVQSSNNEKASAARNTLGIASNAVRRLRSALFQMSLSRARIRVEGPRNDDYPRSEAPMQAGESEEIGEAEEAKGQG